MQYMKKLLSVLLVLTIVALACWLAYKRINVSTQTRPGPRLERGSAVAMAVEGQIAKTEGQIGVPVTVAPVEQKTTFVEVGSFGTVEAYANVELRSQVTGVLTDVNFTEGQMVKKGDLLLTIDPRQEQAALKMAQANLQKDQAQLQNVEKEAARQTELFRKGFASQDDYDNSQTAVETLRAAVSADRAAIENAMLQLDYCSICSPIDGRTGSLHVHKGNLVKPNDTSVVSIMQIEPIYVSFWVPEQYLPAIQKYMSSNELDVRVKRPHENEQPIHGSLTLLDNAVDVNNRTIHLRATFPNKDHSLWPGQYVDVVLTLNREPNSIVVPSQSIQTGQNNQFVYVVKPDQIVEARPVTVKRSLNNEAVVEGVQVGEVVVTDGQLRLIPGARVQIKNQTDGQRTNSQYRTTNNEH
jgi:multidrug efflux system membrane fusion protein